MEEKTEPVPSVGDESYNERELSVMKDDGIPRGTYLRFDFLPKNLCLIVADYISDDKKDPNRFALLGEQSITLCLSQHSNLELGSCWYFGCLSPKDRWESSKEIYVDMKCIMNDYDKCLDFLRRENSPHYAIVVEVLLVQLDMPSQEASRALDDLQYTLEKIREHLHRLRHVILAIEKNVFFYFSFKDVIDRATDIRQAVDRPFAMKQILDDFRTCCTRNQMHDTKLLLDRFIFQDVKPESDKYLSKVVISLEDTHLRDLSRAVTSSLSTDKLVFVQDLETPYDANHWDWRTVDYCHAFCLDVSLDYKFNRLFGKFQRNLCFENSHSIQRIAINSGVYPAAWRLPRPRAPLTDPTLRSALIELSLEGEKCTLDLAQLNNGYFQNLEYLSIIGGNVEGHLDSHSVPSLKTLVLELGNRYRHMSESMKTKIEGHCQSLVHSDHAWQLVATHTKGGWSLASYDAPTANPHHETKNDSPCFPPRPSLPLIRDLLLVAYDRRCFDEWQLQLNSHPSQGAAAGDGSGQLLVWAPECVQKISAFGREMSVGQFDFGKAIPGRERILTSLTFNWVDVVLDGIALPNLRSLEVNYALAMMSGGFPRLEALSFQRSTIGTKWRLDAPLLRSFHCGMLHSGGDLTICPKLLPQLSYLLITLWESYADHSPKIDVTNDPLGLSHVKHVVFDMGMVASPFFDQWQIQNVLHLELAIELVAVPRSWNNIMWRCETLTLNFRESEYLSFIAPETPPKFMLPLLPHLKTLTVTEESDWHVFLDTEMPKLTDLTVTSPRSLNLYPLCPALRSIHFTGELSERDKVKCLNPNTYVAIGAQPEWVYLGDSEEVHRMSWDSAPHAAGESLIAGPSEEVD